MPASEKMNFASLEEALDTVKNWIEEKKYFNADRLLSAIFKEHPRSAYTNYLMGRLALNVADPKTANPFFDTAVAGAPGNGIYLGEYIYSLFLAGELEKARALFLDGKDRLVVGEGHFCVDPLERLLDGRQLGVSAHIEVRKAAEFAWDLFGQAIAQSIGPANQDFSRSGFVAWPLAKEKADGLRGFFDPSLRENFRAEDVAEGYARTELIAYSLHELNRCSIYFAPPSFVVREQLAIILEEIVPHLSTLVGYPLSVWNVRAWEALPSSSGSGPYVFHIDGLPIAIKKLMIYLEPMSEENGTLDIIKDENGHPIRLLEDTPTIVLLDSSRFFHRGVPPSNLLKKRPVIEVTLGPSLTMSNELIFAGHNAPFPIPKPEILFTIYKAARPFNDAWRDRFFEACRTLLSDRMLLELSVSIVNMGDWREAHNLLHPIPILDASSPNEIAVRLAAAIGADAVSDGLSILDGVVPMRQGLFDQIAKGVNHAQIFADFINQAPASFQAIQGTLSQIFVRAYNLTHAPQCLNLGGGPNFLQGGWLNIDGARGFHNPQPFMINADCRLPLNDEAVSFVYSSHHIEHLPHHVALHLFREAFRVLKPGGEFLVKIPDYGMLLNAYRTGDRRFFDEEIWGLTGLLPLWQAHEVENSMEARAAMVFCGYWNPAYGDHFGGLVSSDVMAYHGPVRRSREVIRQIFMSEDSPAAIAARFRAMVLEEEPAAIFNHQTAWSAEELIGDIQAAGFTFQTSDREWCLNRFAEVFQISTYRDISLYALFVKP